MREHLLRMLNEAMEARQDINAMVPQHKNLKKIHKITYYLKDSLCLSISRSGKSSDWYCETCIRTENHIKSFRY